ncbi:tripartite motif-containing protein 2-like [Saccostrea cucullata]|uniref:tripartite motif-containing protein 2-like n=1 Tax=Saccostrea cuccullata TaxID=36930 RepID=UPI002ED19A9A
MDPRLSAQDVIRCDICETAEVQMYCDFCHVKLCKPCIGEHIADEYEKHKIVLFQKKKSTLIYPKCATHPTKTCDLQCKECDIHVCPSCFTSSQHKGHSFLELSEIYNSKKKDIAKDTEELQHIISPTYEEITNDLETQIANFEGEYKKLKTAVTEYGKQWHREIDNVIIAMKKEIKSLKRKHFDILKKHTDEVKQIQSLIEQTLQNLKEIEESNEVSLTFQYSSRNKEFSKLPPKVQISLPMFNPKPVNGEQIYKLFGSLASLSTTTEENGYKLKKPETSNRELLEEPELITTMDTGYEKLRSVACLSEEEIWTSGLVMSDMKCFNIQGSLITAIKTKSGERPGDIAVTSDGDLVYSDGATGTVNKIKNGQTEEMIRLQGWVPFNLCVTSSGDLLVTMFSVDQTHSKVLRYSGSTEKQTIQFDDEDKPLYSGNNKIKYINENRNLDICVADNGTGAVVVVNQAGNLRFRYTGHPSTTKDKQFKPFGITTDSQSQILTSDYHNHCIHILDQDGQFLRNIDDCDLQNPFGLCVNKNNLFVAETSTETMDPRHSAQDVIRCDLCETAIVQMYCDFCHVNLCKPCIGEHIADEYTKHHIVPFQQRKSTLIYPKCATHETKSCELKCKECDIPICSLCSVSQQQKGHNFLVLGEIYNSKKNDIAKDTEEIQNIISPTYEDITNDLEKQIANLDGEYEKLTTAVTEHGEQWHKEIDNIINAMKKEIDDLKEKHFDILKKHAEEVKQIQSLIEQTLFHLKEIEESNEVSMTIEYSSRNKEFSKLPPKIQVSLPMFNPKPVDTEQMNKLFGSLAPLSTTTKENGYNLKKPETSSRELLEEPELITTIDTGYEKLRNVTCLSEEEILTSGKVSDIKCFNMQGSLMKTITKKSWGAPNDIAVTGDGDLVYSDWKTKTVNKVKNGQTEEMIRLQGWVPKHLCVTSSGDLLVTMYSDDRTQSKVVHYSGFTEKQTIQFYEEGKPLYSGNDRIKYISENRNLDICVADYKAGAVVVVNQAGKLRFRYTGHPSTTKTEPFVPHGITTDSQSQILTADYHNHCIHILDQDGQFLRYIDNCDLKNPFGLCVYKNNLFVAEWKGKVKKIKYLE